MREKNDIIAVIGAMGIELKYLRNKMHIISIKEISGFRFIQGNLHDVNLVLAKSGPGRENAGRCCDVLIKEFSPKWVINVGIAGALDESLNVGDIVTANETVQFKIIREPREGNQDLVMQFGSEAGKCVKTEACISKLQMDGLKIHMGSMATGDIFLQNREMKKLIYKRTGALTIDMESGAVAAHAAKFGIPCSIVRAVSDKADETPVSEWEISPENSSDRAAKAVEIYLKQNRTNIRKKLD